MDYQKIFDLTTEHLRLQGRAAVNNHRTCKYRTEDGDACAIGCHIPTADYSEALENKGVAGLSRYYPALLANIFNDGVRLTRDMITFLSDLQSAHDVGLQDSMATWEVEMLRIARMYHLQYTPPQHDETLSLSIMQATLDAAKDRALVEGA